MELDFQYPSEGIHRRWDAGFRITACAATPDQSAFVLSVPRRRPMDETQVRGAGGRLPPAVFAGCVVGGGAFGVSLSARLPCFLSSFLSCFCRLPCI